MFLYSLIKERPIEVLADAAYSPYYQRFGYDSEIRYQIDRDRTLALVEGESELIELQAKHQDIYTQSETPTVVDYKNLMLAKALEASLVNTQYSNRAKTSLVKHSSKVWNTYSFDDLWGYVDQLTQVRYPYYWSTLGTPAYYFYYSKASAVNSDNSTLDLLKMLYIHFWVTFASSTKRTPKDRLERVLKSLKLTPEFLAELQGYHERNYDEYYARRNLITKLTDLKHTLLLSEYDDLYWAPILRDARPEFLEAFSQVTKAVLSMAKPGGFYLITQFLIVEAYTKIAEILDSLPLPLHTSSLSLFLNAFNLELDVKYQVAEYFTLIKDSLAIQTWFQSTPTDTFIQQSLETWLRASTRRTVPLTSEYRLTVFD